MRFSVPLLRTVMNRQGWRMKNVCFYGRASRVVLCNIHFVPKRERLSICVIAYTSRRAQVRDPLYPARDHFVTSTFQIRISSSLSMLDRVNQRRSKCTQLRMEFCCYLCQHVLPRSMQLKASSLLPNADLRSQLSRGVVRVCDNFCRQITLYI
jgi:hypothetical protein